MHRPSVDREYLPGPTVPRQLTNILTHLALLPTLLPSPQTNLPLIHAFLTGTIDPVLAPDLPLTTPAIHRHVVGAENGLMRKMRVKVGGRWWVSWLRVHDFTERRRDRRGARENNGVLEKLGYEGHQEEGDDERDNMELPDGIEEQIDSLMSSLSDKVC